MLNIPRGTCDAPTLNIRAEGLEKIILCSAKLLILNSNYNPRLPCFLSAWTTIVSKSKLLHLYESLEVPPSSWMRRFETLFALSAIPFLLAWLMDEICHQALLLDRKLFDSSSELSSIFQSLSESLVLQQVARFGWLWGDLTCDGGRSGPPGPKDALTRNVDTLRARALALFTPSYTLCRYCVNARIYGSQWKGILTFHTRSLADLIFGWCNDLNR